MGLCASDLGVFVESDIDGQDGIAMEAFTKMKLEKKEIDKLFAVYLKIDTGHSGVVTSEKLRNYFRLDNTPFNRCLFTDIENKGEINFFDFVAIVWNFLGTSPTHLGLHAFYCVNKAEQLKPDRVKDFIEVLYGCRIDGIKALVTAYDDLIGTTETAPGNKVVQAKEFDNYCAEHTILTAAVLRMQLALRKDFLGEPFWREITARRSTDAVIGAPEFIYTVILDVHRKYHEKNVKKQYDERVKKLGGERKGIAEVYETVNVTTIGSTGAEEVVFDHSKVKRAEPKQKRNKKDDFLKELEDAAAVEVMNAKNSPEKLHVLATHEFRYTSEGMGLAAPSMGDWGSVLPKLKPSSPRVGSPRTGSPRGPKVVVEGEAARPRSRGNTIDGGKARHATTPTDGRPGSREGSADGRRPRRATENDANDRPRSRGSDTDRPKSRGDGSRPRSRGSSPAASPRGRDSTGYHHRTPHDGAARPQSPLNKLKEVNTMVIHG